MIIVCSPGEGERAADSGLIEQLKEGGRMVIPVGGNFVQRLNVLEKRGGVVKQIAAIPVKFVPLTREQGAK